ncbi:MAG: chemotaxis protein CheW [Solirubrobacteraceae bacterium]
MAVADPLAGPVTYVRMALGHELYALAVEAVLEVADLGDVTPLPGAPRAVLGVCNLRGNVLPVVDVRNLLGTQDAAATAQRLVVTERGGRRVGLAVDAVIDVGPLPGTPETTDADHLSGAVIVQGALVGFLALDSLLAAVEAST